VAEHMRDMDVMNASRRWSRMTVLGIGTAAGLVFALPVKTGSVACPPANEGRVNCLLQHAWAPAFVKLAAAVLITWLVAELLRRVPELRRRYGAGERLARRPVDLGREAVLSNHVLNAATWGIVPEPKKPAWKVVKPSPNPALAAALALPARAEQAAPEPVPAPAPVPVASVAAAVRALGPAERFRRSGDIGRHVRVLTDDETRNRKLRRGTDPALVVSCWSDASSARDLADDATADVLA
jgi:hypothetical protein